MRVGAGRQKRLANAPPRAERAIGGVGTELSTILESAAAALQVQLPKQCACKANAKQMNIWGPAGCRSNMPRIIGWMRESMAKVEGQTQIKVGDDILNLKAIGDDYYAEMVESAIEAFESRPRPTIPPPIQLPDDPVIHAFRRDFYRAMDMIPDAPQFPLDRGIVIVGGGKFFASLYVTCGMIRQTNCTLPIQVWYLPGEREPWMVEMLARFAPIDWVDAAEVANGLATGLAYERLGGWEAKSLALLASPFRRVLLLDADAYPLYDPSELFDDPIFAAVGAEFWPDGVSTRGGLSGGRLNVEIMSHFGLTAKTHRGHETGQIAIDKTKHWQPLWLTAWLNCRSPLLYNATLWSHGDCELASAAWRACGHEFLQREEAAEWRKVAFVHKDHNDKEFTVHRCRAKFVSPDQAAGQFVTPQTAINPFVQELPGERAAHALFHEFSAARLRCIE